MAVASRMSALIAVIFYTRGIADGVPDTNITSVLCNSGVYTRSDPFAASLTFVLRNLIDGTPASKGYDYYSISPYPNAFAYGHATCSQNLTAAGCKTCLRAAQTTLQDQCPNRIGARAELHDCTNRYEQYAFDETQVP